MATVIAEEIREIICEQLDLEVFNEAVVREAIEVIEISSAEIAIHMKSSLSLEMQAM